MKTMFENLGPNGLLVMFFATAAMTGGLVAAIAYFLWKAIDMGRAWIITLPGTPGALATVKRQRLDEGTIQGAKKEHEGQTFIVDGRTAYPTRKGPVHIVTDYGANLVAPSKDAEYERLLKVATEEAKVEYLQKIKAMGVEKDDALWRELLQKAAKTPLRFRVFDPLIYWRATKENDTEDYYAAQQPKPSLMERLVPVMLLAVIAFAALAGFVLWKVLPLLQQKVAGG